ncbi:MAG: AlpA family transcriptional regulator [Oceanospirillaceae bacterium]|uniref:helix-turn-helix transcriptional regulator n=1 Tax=Marinobacterium litorale TaxID=404770 RepID=UPI00040A3B80|nr:AlpA family transcriptional regulator [Marinobacterium litorale]MBS98270.1 AlpA family transcriptional regulator [Oceanospirillaceae bacterium]
MRLLRRPEVQRMTGLSRSTIYRLISEDQFPPPVSLGGNSVAWIEHELEQWILERIEQRDLALDRNA